jgi:pentapeptide MXKDX repeat protein
LPEVLRGAAFFILFPFFWFTGLVLFGVLPCGQRFREDAMHEDAMHEDAMHEDAMHEDNMSEDL